MYFFQFGALFFMLLSAVFEKLLKTSVTSRVTNSNHVGYC